MANNPLVLKRKKSVWSKLLHSWQLYVLLLPAFVYFGIFNYGPMYGLQIAFRDFMPSLGISGSPWVGLRYFQRFIRMPQFFNLISNTVTLSFFSLICNFPMPIILALMLNEVKNHRYKKLVQNVTYAPYFISMVVMVGMMIAFLSPRTGIINKVIVELFGGNATDFMTRPEWFRPLYILSTMWQATGWNSIIYIAALSGIDPQLHESAQIDGASRLQRIWHINIPGILPTIIILFILNSGHIMNVGFEKTFLMQNPLNLSTSEVISTYVYKVGLLGAQFSFTSAVGFFNSVINFILLLTVNAISKRVSQTSLW